MPSSAREIRINKRQRTVEFRANEMWCTNRRGGVRVSSGDLCIRKYAEAQPSRQARPSMPARARLDFTETCRGRRLGDPRTDGTSVPTRKSNLHCAKFRGTRHRSFPTARGTAYEFVGAIHESPERGRILQKPNGGRGSPPLRVNQIHFVQNEILRFAQNDKIDRRGELCSPEHGQPQGLSLRYAAQCDSF